MFSLKDTQWAGREDTYEEAKRLEASCIARMSAFTGQEEDAPDVPRLYSRRGNAGVVTVRGPLINSDHPMTSFFGISTYPAIREAFAFAASDSSVDKILLDIDSGGGQVSGVADTARLISTVNKIKPVTAFTDNLAASAAYWLSSAAGSIVAGELAIVGSIGVITTHVSVHDALKQQGIEVTVLRVGENKALGHPAEKLTPKAEKQIMDQMNVVYDKFTGFVAERRDLAIAKRDTWANGNEFIGEDTVKAGLVDKISTADSVYAQLAVDNRNSLNNTQKHNKRANVKTPIKVTLEPALLAAAEAGTATAEQLADIATAKAAAEAAASTAASETETAAATPAVETPAASLPAAGAEAEVAKPVADKPESEIVAFLRSELKTAQEALVAERVKLTAVEAKIADINGSHKALAEIARNSVNKMAVALGGTAATLENLSDVELVEKHGTVQAEFTKVFKTGGVAVTVPATEETTTASNVTPIERARVQATGLK